MAIVTDKSGANPTSGSFITHTRSVAGTPVGSTVPAFVGEVIWDSTNKLRYKAVALTNNDWVALTTTTGYL